MIAQALAVLATVASTLPTPTLKNLQRAQEADASAQARYAAFAGQAEREGYLAVATLFRAAARSESVRARNHAAALRKHGVEPGAGAAPAAVGTTRENLLRTLAHENAERAGAYPRFARQARQDGDAEAMLSFVLAHAAERQLLVLYRDALARLERMRAQGEALYVCETCGYIARGHPPEQCPVSLSGADAFVRV